MCHLTGFCFLTAGKTLFVVVYFEQISDLEDRLESKQLSNVEKSNQFSNLVS